jgi:hypothetical protein
MPRHELIQKSRQPRRFEQYVRDRRSLHDQVHAASPLRFLRRLGLVPALDRTYLRSQPREWPQHEVHEAQVQSLLEVELPQETAEHVARSHDVAAPVPESNPEIAQDVPRSNYIHKADHHSLSKAVERRESNTGHPAPRTTEKRSAVTGREVYGRTSWQQRAPSFAVPKATGSQKASGLFPSPSALNLNTPTVDAERRLVHDLHGEQIPDQKQQAILPSSDSELSELMPFASQQPTSFTEDVSTVEPDLRMDQVRSADQEGRGFSTAAPAAELPQVLPTEKKSVVSGTSPNAHVAAPLDAPPQNRASELELKPSIGYGPSVIQESSTSRSSPAQNAGEEAQGEEIRSLPQAEPGVTLGQQVNVPSLDTSRRRGRIRELSLNEESGKNSATSLTYDAKRDKSNTDSDDVHDVHIARVGKKTRPESGVNAPPEDSPSSVPSAARDSGGELFADSLDQNKPIESWAAMLEKAFPLRRAGSAVVTGSVAKASPIAPQRESVATRLLHEAPQTPPSSKGPEGPEPLIRLSQSTRRFLRPLVGIDPNTVPIYSGPAAEQITSSQHADGISVDGAIALRPSQVGETPEQLGLLAHEMTHVARQREPHFVPPIVKALKQSGPSSPKEFHEETLARRVEAHVADAAAGRTMKSPSGVSANLPHQHVTATSSGPSPKDKRGLNPVASEAEQETTWGGLPTPWEPLPHWVTTSLSSPEPVSVRNVSGAPSAPSTSEVASTLQRAEEGRSLDRPAASGPSGSAEDSKTVAPDLDVLAKQVYAVLKRRLDVERRRQFM